MPYPVELSKFRGDTLELPITITDNNDVPINLIGATIKFTLASVPAITEATEGVVITRDDINGKFTITVPDTVMNTLSAKKYIMDVEVKYATGRKDTLFVLELNLLGDVTP